MLNSPSSGERLTCETYHSPSNSIVNYEFSRLLVPLLVGVSSKVTAQKCFEADWWE